MLPFKNRLHATTWWLLGIFGAVLASSSHTLGFLVLLALLAFATMAIFRDSTLRSRSLGFYAWLALSVIVIRLVFRVVFNQPDYLAQIAINLPQVSFQLWGSTVTLFGAVSQKALMAGLIDGTRLATIIVCIGMANTVANPRKLLRSTPTALYEVATAAAVAINLAPQLVESLHRVRKARQLRGAPEGFASFTGSVIPVLEGALESSLELAASMDARGFGLQSALSSTQRTFSKVAVLAGVIISGISAFALVAMPGFEIAALAGFALAVILLVTSFKYAAKHRVRSFYRIEAPEVRDYLCLLLAIALGSVAWMRFG